MLMSGKADAKKEETAKSPSSYEIEESVLSIIDSHSEEKSPLLPILQDVQKAFGFISPQAMFEMSETLDIPLSQVYSAVTFYNEFRTKKRGKHLFRVCIGTACCIKKADAVILELEKELGIQCGQTDKKGLFTLETVNCFGACGLGPIVEVDGRIFSLVEPKKAKALAEEVKKKEGLQK